MTALRRLVLLVALAGLGLQALVGVVVGGDGPVVSALSDGPVLAQLPPYALLVGLLALTVAADLVCVPVRRGEQVEELTLFEAAVVAAVLLLPARDALWVPLAAIAIASVVQRRDPLKSAFNLGNQGAATALLVLVVHALAGPDAGLGGRTVLALVLGLLAFSAVNLVGLTLVLRVVGEADARHVLRDGARLALVTVAAAVAMAGGGVLAAARAPALLPFCLVPAVALVFAFRATAQASEQRQRSTRLLALSHVLAGRGDPDEMVPAFLAQCRQAFGADVALALLTTTGSTSVDDREHGPAHRPTTAADRTALHCAGEARALGGHLPHGWTSGVVAPLEADGVPLGVLVLASRERSRAVGTGELVLLSPLASALAVALRGAAHLRRLTEATSKLQAVVDQSSDGILVLDGTGAVQLWSPALTALTGRVEPVPLGGPLPAGLAVLGAPGGALTADAPRRTVEVTVSRPDGEPREVRCAHAGAFVDGRLDRDVVIVHDVTREREVERLKADFIATVSHELRTPVTPIKGYADLLRRKGDSLSPARRAEYLGVISDRCDHLARLVEDLLLASRITDGSSTAQVTSSVHDLHDLVRRAAADSGDDRLTVLTGGAEVAVRCDPVRAVQVLRHLLDNALKYSGPDAPVDVVVGADGAVEVRDRGRGIPADQLERVFDKLHRVEDPLRMTTGGAGLGLYLARQLAEAMGGTVTCRSVLGAGSVFRFALPRVQAPQDTLGAVAPDTLGAVPPRPRPAPEPTSPPAALPAAPYATPPRSAHAAALPPH